MTSMKMFFFYDAALAFVASAIVCLSYNSIIAAGVIDETGDHGELPIVVHWSR